MDVYATNEDVTAWPIVTTLDGGTIDRYLRSASILVARACNRDLYAGLTGTDIPQGLRDATVSQVATWIKLGIDPATIGIATAPVKKSTVLGADVERDTGGQFDAFRQAVGELGPESKAILISANLIWLPIPIGGGDGLVDWGVSASRTGDLNALGIDVGWPADWPFT